jgi:hypothetical protein
MGGGMMKNTKPLGRKSYGSIGHLPNSRLGPGDHSVHFGQARICTEKTRDKHDTVIVQEKLDGSCTSVALLDGVIYSLGRAGYEADTSQHEQHRMFADWVTANEDRFRGCLREGERLVGEWLAQAHGTKYDIADREPWGVFDLMVGTERTTYYNFLGRVAGVFAIPHTLHVGDVLSVEAAMELHEKEKWPCEETEGVVYRVERKGKVDFLAKWVKPTKVDGKYLPEISGDDAVWNWRPIKREVASDFGGENESIK